jgi:hypothetical protein
MHSFNSCLLLLFIMVCITSCHSKRQHRQWEYANFDRAIAKNVVYRQLDKEGEVFSMHDTNCGPFRKNR